MNDDGIALTNIAHPTAPWYKRIWFWLRRPQLSPDALETIEIELSERPVYLPADELLEVSKRHNRHLRTLLDAAFFNEPERYPCKHCGGAHTKAFVPWKCIEAGGEAT